MLSVVLFLLIFILIMAVAFQRNADTWKAAFSNDDGTPSSARVFTALLLIALISWADVFVRMPQGKIPDIPSTWEQLLYVLLAYSFGKKVLDVVQTVKGTPAGPVGGGDA